MVAQQHRMTVEEFMGLPADGNLHELVRGEVRVMPPPKGEHGFIEAAIVAAIDRYLHERARSIGWIPEQGLAARNGLVGKVGGGEVGLCFAVPDDPNMIRGADVVYIPPEQLGHVIWDERHDYFPAVPALVAEVISETDRASAVAERVQDYLAGGGMSVWCIYPDQRAVYIYCADGPTRVVRGNDAITDDLLPGFSLSLNLLFG
jgi:Uma2 family endonuclease